MVDGHSSSAGLALAALATFVLGGSAVAANAAEGSRDEVFESAFAGLGEPVEVAVPPHAVDIDTIEPTVEDTGEEIGQGIASWYGREFAGRRTASGERFDPGEHTAAHRTLPFGTRLRVTYERTGRSVVVRINDRGPFHGNRVIDLSQAAAEEIGLRHAGSGRVRMALLDS